MVKPIWILLKQETVSSSGISWAICMSALRFRQIATPVPDTQFFTGWMPFLPPNQQRQCTEGIQYSTVTHTHPFNGPLSGTTQVSRCPKGKTNLDFIGARDNEWQWHQLGHMQIYTSLQTNNHSSTPPLSFLQAGCPSCRPTNSVKALKVPYST